LRYCPVRTHGSRIIKKVAKSDLCRKEKSGFTPLPYAGITRIRFKGLSCHGRILSTKLP